MKALSFLAIVAFCMIGCAKKNDVPKPTSDENPAPRDASLQVSENASVQYENYVARSTVAVEGSLADLLITELNDEPDQAERNVGMGLDNLKYLGVGAHTFQVLGSALILMDGWGTRTWHIDDIEAKLDALISLAYENSVIGETVAIEGPLVDLILTKLRGTHDEAKRDVGNVPDTRKYLHVGTRTFQVLPSSLKLIDDSGNRDVWAVRFWHIDDIEATLDALLPNATNGSDAGNG